MNDGIQMSVIIVVHVGCDAVQQSRMLGIDLDFALVTEQRCCWWSKERL